MKTELSSVDVHVLAGELNDGLAGARVDKVYQVKKRELVMTLRRNEKTLVIGQNFICLSSYSRKAPEQPTSFAMQLRKHLSGGVIKNVAQHEFDRIVEIKFESSGKEYTLIVELFSKGNVILVDNEKKIIGLLDWQKWKDRTLGVGQSYEYPPATPNALKLGENEFRELMKSEKSVVSVLATKLGIGGFWSEELCMRAGLDKTKSAEKISESETERLYKTLLNLLEMGKLRPVIVLDNGKFADVVPFPADSREGHEQKTFESFNDAVDEYFSSMEVAQSEESVESKCGEKLKRLEQRLSDQEKALKILEENSELYRKQGDLLYQNLHDVQSIVDEIAALRKKGLHDAEISERLKSGGIFKSLDKTELVLDL